MNCPMCDQMGAMMGPMMAWMMGAGVLVTLLVIAVLALLAVWLFQQVRGGPRRQA